MLRWISAATLAQRHSKSSWLSFGLGRYKASPAKVLIPSVHDTVDIDMLPYVCTGKTDRQLAS